MITVNTIALTKEIDQITAAELNEEQIILGGKFAGTCYAREGYATIRTQPVEKAVRRAKDTAERGHHSVFQHGVVTMEIICPKIIAMLLNSIGISNTSEKSARYTKMKPETQKEQELYQKWHDIFVQEITKRYNERFNEKEKDKLAYENARYMISVFCETSMVYSLPFRNIFYILDWMERMKKNLEKMEGGFNKRLCDEIILLKEAFLSINEYHWKDNDILAIDDFTFSALCLLNKSSDVSKNVRPCFPSCRVEKMKAFSINTDKFKQNFELILKKLKQYESDGTTTSVQNNATNNNPHMEGENKMDFAKITELLSKSDDNCTYRLLNATENKVFALDLADYKPYGFDYAVTKTDDTESIVIDFESKTEMSLSAVDKITDENFDEFSIKNEIDTIKETYAKELVDTKVKEVSESVSATFQKDYDELKEAYDNLTKSHNILQSKVDSYEKKENEAKIEAHKNEINSLVDSYADKLGKYSAYLVYKANIEQKYSMTTEQVEQDLILMAGRYLTSKENSFKRNFSYNPTEAGVNGRANEATTNKYGHLLDKYIK